MITPNADTVHREGTDVLDIHQKRRTKLLPEYHTEMPSLRFNLFHLTHAQLSRLFPNYL